MSQSLANIVLHLVFSTKNRVPFLRDKERGPLHAYITGIFKNLESPLMETNSVGDHIHILFAHSKNRVPAKIVEQVKSSSSGMDQATAPVVLRFCLAVRLRHVQREPFAYGKGETLHSGSGGTP